MNPSNTQKFSIPQILSSPPGSILGVAILYALVAKVSFLVTILPGDISPIFPAAGIALAAVLILGRSALPGVWLGSFAANTLSIFNGRIPADHGVLPTLLVGALIGVGAMCGAGAGATLVRRFCNREHPLHSGLNVLKLVAAGALVCCMISPTVGVLSLSLGGYTPWKSFGYSWLTWWIGDTAGVIVATPFLLAWYHPQPGRGDSWRFAEGVVLAGVTLLLCLFIFFRNMRFEYGLMPLLLWSAFRFGMRGATTSAAVIALFATIGTWQGSSPFVKSTANESLLLLHSFLAVTIVCALFLAGILAERRRAEAEVRESEERLSSLGDNLPDSYVYQYTSGEDGAPRFLYLSAGVEKMHGVKAEEVLNNPGLLHRLISPEQLPALQAAEAASLKALSDFEMELKVQNADGQWRWLLLRSRPTRKQDDRIVWDGVATDITATSKPAQARGSHAGWNVPASRIARSSASAMSST